MPNYPALNHCDERQDHVVPIAQHVDQPRFDIATEGLAVDMSDGRGIVRVLLADGHLA